MWPMRILMTAASTLLGATMAVGLPSPGDGQPEAQLKQLFPTASTFSPKGGTPPHFSAYLILPSGERTLLGVAFWTTELEPLERGYDGPIKILVGMKPNGILSGIVVVDHHEPYGYFSIDSREFALQFAGKNIRDPFTVGVDVDASIQSFDQHWQRDSGYQEQLPSSGKTTIDPAGGSLIGATAFRSWMAPCRSKSTQRSRT